MNLRFFRSIFGLWAFAWCSFLDGFSRLRRSASILIGFFFFFFSIFTLLQHQACPTGHLWANRFLFCFFFRGRSTRWRFLFHRVPASKSELVGNSFTTRGDNFRTQWCTRWHCHLVVDFISRRKCASWWVKEADCVFRFIRFVLEWTCVLNNGSELSTVFFYTYVWILFFFCCCTFL